MSLQTGHEIRPGWALMTWDGSPDLAGQVVDTSLACPGEMPSAEKEMTASCLLAVSDQDGASC
jgi:hypothetical protein